MKRTNNKFAGFDVLLLSIMLLLFSACNDNRKLIEATIISVPWSITTRTPIKINDMDSLSLSNKQKIRARDTLEAIHNTMKGFKFTNEAIATDLRIVCIFQYDDKSSDTIVVGRFNSLSLNNKSILLDRIFLREIIKHIPSSHKMELPKEYR